MRTSRTSSRDLTVEAALQFCPKALPADLARQRLPHLQTPAGHHRKWDTTGSPPDKGDQSHYYMAFRTCTPIVYDCSMALQSADLVLAVAVPRVWPSCITRAARQNAKVHSGALPDVSLHEG
jgi:hypothetical protein